MSEIRDEVSSCLKKYKSSWLGLGKLLFTVNSLEHYKEWGFDNFSDYCKEELGLSTSIVNQIISAYEYIQNNNPALINTIEKDPTAYVPDYSTLSSLSKVAKDDPNVEEKFRQKVFDMNEKNVAKQLKDELKNEENPMDEIKEKTIKIKKNVKKLDKQIHEISSFGNEVLEASEKLNNLVEKTEI